jgi:hypothetical protein
MYSLYIWVLYRYEWRHSLTYTTSSVVYIANLLFPSCVFQFLRAPFLFFAHIRISPFRHPTCSAFTLLCFCACLQRYVASSSDGTTLLAAVEGGSLWRSTDSGLTWAALSSAGQVRRTPAGRRRTRATSRALHSISQESQPELQYYLCSSENN